MLSWSQVAPAQSSGASGRHVDVTVGSRLTYDTNVLRQAGGPGAPAGYDRGDFRVTPSVDLDISLPISRQSLFLSGSIGYDFYQKNTQLNRERISLLGGVNLNVLGSCSTTFSGEYVRQQSDLADLIGVGDLTNTEERRAVDARVACGSAIGLRPTLGFRHQTVDNNIPVRRVGDYNSDTIDASIGYTRPSLGTISIYAETTDTTYPRRRLGPVEDGVKFYSMGARFEREIGSRLRGTVSVGFTKVVPKLVGDGFKGLSYSASLDFQPSERLHLGLLASRAAQASSLLDANYTITESYALDGNYALNRRFRLMFGAAYANRQFDASPLIPGAIDIGGDRTYRGNAGLQYIWNDRLTLGLDYTYERRDAGNSFFDYSHSIFGLSARLGI